MAREVTAATSLTLPAIQADVAQEQARAGSAAVANTPASATPDAPEAPPVVIAASVVQVKVGDILTGQVLGVDSEGHNLLVTSRGVFAIDPIGALGEGDLLTLTVLRADREIGARIIRQNNLPRTDIEQLLDLRLSLVATPTSVVTSIDPATPETPDALAQIVRQVAEALANPATTLASHATGQLDNQLAHADDIGRAFQSNISGDVSTVDSARATSIATLAAKAAPQRTVADFLLLSSSSNAAVVLDKLAIDQAAATHGTVAIPFVTHLPQATVGIKTSLPGNIRQFDPVPTSGNINPVPPHAVTAPHQASPQFSIESQQSAGAAAPTSFIVAENVEARLSPHATLTTQQAARPTPVSVLAVLPATTETPVAAGQARLAPGSPLDILIRSQRAVVATVIEVKPPATTSPSVARVTEGPARTTELLVELSGEAQPVLLTLPSYATESPIIGTRVILLRDKPPGASTLPGGRQPAASIEHVKDHVQIDLLQQAINLARAPVLQNHLARRLPRPGPTLTAQVAFLIHALKGGGSDWLPTSSDPPAQAQRAQILAALDNIHVRRDVSSDAASAPVVRLLLPLALGPTVVPLTFFVEPQPAHQRQQDERDGNTTDSPDDAKRFVMNVEFPAIGSLEIRGQTSHNQLHLDLRTKLALPETLQASTTGIFTATLAEQGLGGTIKFSTAESPVPVLSR